MPVRDAEIESIILARNRVARYTSDVTRMPRMLSEREARGNGGCGRCFKRTPCAVMHRLGEGGTRGTCGMDPAQWDEETQGLTDVHAEYFGKMEKAISLEEQEANVRKMDVWGGESAQREIRRSCIGGMDMVRWELGGGGGWRYHFKRGGGCSGSKVPLEELCEAMVGQNVMVRREGGGAMLGMGKLMRGAAPGEVWVSSEKPIKKARGSTCGMWRLDKDEFAGSWAKNRAHLVRLFAKGGDEKRRRLVVDLEPPRFADCSQVSPRRLWSFVFLRSNLAMQARVVRGCSGPARAVHASGPDRCGCDEPPWTQVQTSGDAARLTDMVLNAGQTEAVMHVVCAKDYAMLLGMPGTGKTTTIAAAVKVMVGLGKRVLITAYTNNAVDNVLAKLAEIGVPFSRLAKEEYVPHAAVRGSLLTAAGCKTTEELAERLASVRVLGMTCAQTSSQLLTGQTFDVCICDEASQVCLRCPLSLPWNGTSPEGADRIIFVLNKDDARALIASSLLSVSSRRAPNWSKTPSAQHPKPKSS